MSQNLSVNQTYQYVADYLLNAKNNAVQLLQVNGVDINSSATPAQLQAAFLEAIASSPGFRAQAAAAIAKYNSSKQLGFGGQQTPAGRFASFGGQQTPTGHFQGAFETKSMVQFTGPGAIDYLNDTGEDPNASDYYGSDPLVGPSDTDDDDLPVATSFNPNAITIENPNGSDAAVNTNVLPNAAPGNNSTTLFSSTPPAAAVVKPASTTSATGLTGLLQSGLNLASTGLTTSAQKAQAQSALALAQEQLAAKALTPADSSLTTILIVVAVVAVLGGVGYAIFHKKKS